jgi:hypothetical protein
VIGRRDSTFSGHSGIVAARRSSNCREKWTQEFEMRNRTGGCNCGKVRFQVEGDPIRVGICHCQICRKDTGSSFNFFAVWSSKNVAIVGDTESWIHSTDHRHFCATCGSSLYSIVNGTNEVEIRAGAFDNAPSGLLPTYELWLIRRERWLRPIEGAEQHTGNRS